MKASCSHLDQIRITDKGSARGCEECLRLGMQWVHLRRCLACGHIGCCDSSPGRHATAHFKSTGHAVMASAEPGDSWRWCYVDRDYV